MFCFALLNISTKNFVSIVNKRLVKECASPFCLKNNKIPSNNATFTNNLKTVCLINSVLHRQHTVAYSIGYTKH